MRTERLEAAEIAQIYKLCKVYAEAANSRDTERWIELWHSDGIQLPPNSPQLCGKAEIREYLEILADDFPSEYSINPDVVQILGDHAYAHGSFSFLARPKGNAEIEQIQGKFLVVLKKQGDGSWKILVDCFNYDRDLEQDDSCSIM